MSNDNSPFAIRLEVLKMAKDMVMEEFYSERDRVNELWHASERTGKLDFPQFPDDSRVINKAKELYTFITTKI